MAKSPLKPKSQEAPPINLQPQLQFVHVSRPKNIVTTVNDVDDIDVRDGSLLLLKRAGNGRETCMMVFWPRTMDQRERGSRLVPQTRSSRTVCCGYDRELRTSESKGH